MRILVAPQEFKGTLSAVEAADAMSEGVLRAAPGAAVTRLPMSDGGPGLVEAMLAAAGGERVETPVHDPLMRRVEASWGVLPDGTAVIEMAAASGLSLLRPEERDALAATTYGTGELLRAALDHGAARIILGIGGSATTDAGAGAMQALGARLLDRDGRDLAPGGGSLVGLARFDLGGVDSRLGSAGLRIASDVQNTLTGPNGAARMYAPQKGASPRQVEQLEEALTRFAGVAREQLGVDLFRVRGGGAAGGLACGLLLISSALVEPGFDLVAGAVGLAAQISQADLVLTGEGRFDAQSGFGKTAAGVARLARAAGTPVWLIAGSIGRGADVSVFDRAVACVEEGGAVPRTAEEARSALMAATGRPLREAWHQVDRR